MNLILTGQNGERLWDMNDTLDDIRDRTIFVEYYPEFCLTTVWRENGTVDYSDVRRYVAA